MGENSPDYMFSKAKTLVINRRVKQKQITHKHIWFEVEGEDIKFDKNNYTFTCTCKDASHFTVNRAIPCEHIVACIVWLCLKRYEIKVEK